ncbi:MAG: YHS domain-containing protein [Patescibacteria group bacterium]
MFRSFFSLFKNDSSRTWKNDPVCNMPASDELTFDWKAKTYFFCSDHCKRQFEKNPEAYITK